MKNKKSILNYSAMVVLLFLSSCGCSESNFQDKIDAAIESKSEEVKKHAREEMKEEFNLQSQQLIKLMVRYSDAMQRLVWLITEGIGKHIYIRFNPATKQVVFDEDGLRADFGMDIKDKLVMRFNALASLGMTIYDKGQEDLEELAKCTEDLEEACELTPDRLVTGLLKIDPDHPGLLRVQKDFKSIRADVVAMLQEDYWIEIADTRTRNIIRKSFGL